MSLDMANSDQTTRTSAATRQVSPVALTELCFSRIDRLGPQLNSYLLLTRETAMKEAKAAEEAVVREDELGASHGLLISYHIVGRKGGEEAVMAVSAAFERARLWIPRSSCECC